MINCPFCNPRVIEMQFIDNQYFYAIYNHSPILPGHSLIIPKNHVERFGDLQTELSSALFPFTQKVMSVLQQAFNVADFDLTIQDGAKAGQTIPHLHLHVIPRYINDLPNPGDWYPIFRKHENNELIDSFNRPKIPIEKLNEITSYLKETASIIFNSKQ